MSFLRFEIIGLILCSQFILADAPAYSSEPHNKYHPQEPGKTLTLVFCPINYRILNNFIKDGETLVRKLKITRPFDESNNIRFWYINLSPQEASRIFKSSLGFPPLKIREDFILKISLKLNSVYKLVIIDAQGSTSCAELSYLDKTSLIILGRARYRDRNSLAKGFLHELGHSLGLRDESPNGQASRCAPGTPNCAVSMEEAERWWGDLAGKDGRTDYIFGCCGNMSYIRPTIASLMHDSEKAEDFGPVNERYLRKELDSLKTALK